MLFLFSGKILNRKIYRTLFSVQIFTVFAFENLFQYYNIIPNSCFAVSYNREFKEMHLSQNYLDAGASAQN